jgi:hypothetical protein
MCSNVNGAWCIIEGSISYCKNKTSGDVSLPLTLRVRSYHTKRRLYLNACLLQLSVEEAELPLHLITPPHLIGELALEGAHLRVQLEEGKGVELDPPTILLL